MNGPENHLEKLGIKLHKMESQISEAIDSETTYWRRNDAKLKAVEMKVPTYEHFRQLVEGSHLKCLNNKEKLEGIHNGENKNLIWNQILIGFQQQTECSNTYEREKCIESMISKTSNVQSLIRSWRFIERNADINSKNRLHLILLLCQNPKVIRDLFQGGQGVAIFSQVTDALISANYQDIKEINGVINILRSIGDSGQVEMAVLCMSEDSHAHLITFLKHLKNNHLLDASIFELFLRN